jgi:hypothetical protein
MVQPPAQAFLDEYNVETPVCQHRMRHVHARCVPRPALPMQSLRPQDLTAAVL